LPPVAHPLITPAPSPGPGQRRRGVELAQPPFTDGATTKRPLPRRTRWSCVRRRAPGRFPGGRPRTVAPDGQDRSGLRCFRHDDLSGARWRALSGARRRAEPEHEPEVAGTSSDRRRRQPSWPPPAWPDTPRARRSRSS